MVSTQLFSIGELVDQRVNGMLFSTATDLADQLFVSSKNKTKNSAPLFQFLFLLLLLQMFMMLV
jgi:hypothetical protein